MTRRVASDIAVRERAIHALDTSIALSAGAGSGKTSVLVARVLALLERGVEPRRIAAITFTEKAAGELQERIRDGLERALAAAPEHPALARAMADSGELVLATIHSFCQQLLVAEALDAGWAPDTAIGDELFGTPGVEQAFRRWRREFEAGHPIAGLLLRQLVPSSELRKAVARLVDFRDLDPVVDERPFDTALIHAEIQARAAQLESLLTACKTPATCKLLANNAEFIPALRSLAEQPDPDAAVLRATLHPAKTSKVGGRQGDWHGDGVKQFKAFLDDWRGFEAEILVQLHARVVLDARARLLPAIERCKAEAGRAGFDDLLFRAAALLQDDHVRARLAARYDALLIDEVQDTDPIQAEVAALLARDPNATGPWDAHAPRPGHLFAVGDAKQSIYRFRRADVATWTQLRALVSREGEQLELRQNFRSVPGVVAWVDHVFADLPGYVTQDPWRPGASLDPVVLITAEEPDDEITAVAAHLLELRERNAEVFDPKLDQLRPLRWDDVMILLPAWTRAERVQQVLADAGIPALVEGGAGFLERPEIQLCLAAMRAIDEVGDGEAVVLVLRGLFGCTHDDLLRHRRAGGSWRYTLPDPPAGPVADAFALLQDLRRARGRSGWVPLIDELLRRTRAASVWALLRDGDTRLANLDKLRTLIRQLEPECPSPSAVIERLAELAESERDLNRADLDAAAVRITSYFKAKGLEAPVVALCGATRRHGANAPVVDRLGRRVALKVGGELAPPDWDAVWAKQDKREAADERRRWMYVAATRARDQLIIAASPSAELVWDHLLLGQPSLADAGHDERVTWAPGVTTLVRRADRLAPLPASKPTFPGHDALVDGLLVDPPAAASGSAEAWLTARRQAIRAAAKASVRWRSVGEIATRERVVAAGPGGVGAPGGQLVHAVLEQLDLARPQAELEAAVTQLLPRLRPDDMDDALFGKCAVILARILVHEVIGRARAAALRLQELPFCFPDRGRQVSGTIDLCFPIDAARERWVVVDWKSDVPPEGTPARRNYERQLALYAKALLATVAPCTQVETLLVGPYPELGASEREHALAEVDGRLRPGLARLLDRGVAVPKIGLELGDGMAPSELAWEGERLAVLLDPVAEDVAALEREGWTVLAAATDELTWVETLLRALDERLVPAP